MKRISPATVTIGVLAVLFGLGAAYATRLYLESRIVRPRGVELVVPAINLPPYARIREEDLKVIQVAAKNVPPGAVTNRAQALFRLVKSTIMAGQPILEDQLYPVGKTPTLAEQLPPGHRAVTINVDARNALDGVLLPESLVDISLTVQGEHPELAGVATLTLLRQVRVLATNRDRFRTEERVNNPLRSVTVAVSPEQANKLILAQRYGVLSVTLVGAGDEQLAVGGDRDLVNPLDLLGLGPVGVAKTQIWRGTGKQEITFNGAEIEEAESTAVRENASETESVAEVDGPAGEMPWSAVADAPHTGR